MDIASLSEDLSFSKTDQPFFNMTAGKVVQITNIAPQATRDQMQTLFGYLGKIEDIRLYPTIRDVAVPVQSRICYVKFHDPVCVSVAQHMTNTVFIDRALIVIPYQNEIPDEQKALELTNQGTSLFPTEPKLPPNVTNQLEGMPPNQVITTHDPKLVSCGLPLYPPLPANLDSRRIEEIRRTITVSNIDQSLSSQDIIDFFTNAGEVKYTRFCTRDGDNEKYALVEFTDQTSIIPALQLNGKELGGRTIKVYHSVQAITKPQAKSNEAAQREIEEAMTRVKEAQNLISAAIDPVIGLLAKEKKRSRSGSRSRRSRSLSRGRRRSHSRGRRSRSRSRRRSRNRGRSRSRSRRSHSRSKRSRSRSRKRKSRSPGRRRRSHSRTRSRSRRRSRSRSRRSKSKSSKNHDKSKEKKDDKKDSKRESSKKDKEPETENKPEEQNGEKENSEQNPGTVSETKDVEKEYDKEKEKSKSKSKDKSKEKSSREKSKSSRGRSSSRSPSKSHHRSPRRKSRSPRKKSRSPSRRKSPSRRRSSSRSRRKSRSPRSSHSRHSPSRKRSRSRSKTRKDSDRKRDKERSNDDRKDRDRDGDRDRRKKEKKESSEKDSEKGPSAKVPRNYDEEEEGFDAAEQNKTESVNKEPVNNDNTDVNIQTTNIDSSENNEKEKENTQDTESEEEDGSNADEDEDDEQPEGDIVEKKSSEECTGKVEGQADADDMDISTSP